MLFQGTKGMYIGALQRPAAIASARCRGGRGAGAGGGANRSRTVLRLPAFAWVTARVTCATPLDGAAAATLTPATDRRQ
jgi:hypothetical protein